MHKNNAVSTRTKKECYYSVLKRRDKFLQPLRFYKLEVNKSDKVTIINYSRGTKIPEFFHYGQKTTGKCRTQFFLVVHSQ